MLNIVIGWNKQNFILFFKSNLTTENVHNLKFLNILTLIISLAYCQYNIAKLTILNLRDNCET